MMKRWMGWMMAGAMALGGSALAGGDKEHNEQTKADRPGTIEEAKPDTGQEAQEGMQQGMGGSGQQAQEGMGGSGQQGQSKAQGQSDSATIQGSGGSTEGVAKPQMANTVQAGATDPAQLMKQGQLPIPTDEKAFLERLHHGNQQEIKLGELAQQKASLDSVKKFGQMMVKDHTASDAKVMAYAKQKGYELSEPQPTSELEQKFMAAHKAQTEKLQALEGRVFDQAYLTAMVGSHDSKLAKLMTGTQQFANTELAPMLTTMAAKVRQHRDHAYQLLGKQMPKAQARRTGTGGSGSMESQSGSSTGGSGSENMESQKSGADQLQNEKAEEKGSLPADEQGKDNNKRKGGK